MLSIVKENPISHGKDPNVLAVTVLYAACLKEGERVSQAQIAVAGDTSIVTHPRCEEDISMIYLCNSGFILSYLHILCLDLFRLFSLTCRMCGCLTRK
ncbi:MAG: hypothetical protein M3Y53_01900 [Thermoproteota archaeon]|nr:hypothetical protein [Thermoproteota archaeon]